jgi:hypothetical protein
MTFRLSICTALFLFNACAQTEQLDVDEFFDDGKQDGERKPLGTLVAVGELPGDPVFPYVTMLVLRSDQSFMRLDATSCTGDDEEDRECEHAAVRGTYRFTRSGSKRFIRFTDSAGTLLDRLEYRFNDTNFEFYGELEVRRGQGMWQTLDRDGYPYCEASSECSLQGEQPGCEAAWSCEFNTCRYSCDTREPVLNACEAAGGRCVSPTFGGCSGARSLEIGDGSDNPCNDEDGEIVCCAD